MKPLSFRYAAHMLLLCLAVLAPARSAPASAAEKRPAELTPLEVVLTAADKPNGVSGTVRMKVLATGQNKEAIFLNSELDYRDFRCLTVVIPNLTAQSLAKKLGADPRAYFQGKTILVTGRAKRVQIFLHYNGVMTDKYYFQTHLRVVDVDQIAVAPQ